MRPDATVIGSCWSLMNEVTRIDILSPPGMTLRMDFSHDRFETRYKIADLKLLYKISTRQDKISDKIFEGKLIFKLD